MESMQLPHFAILSGLFGTAASVFGKFISYSDEFIENIPIDTSQAVSDVFIQTTNRTEKKTDKFLQEFLWRWSLKLVCIGLMILCNVFVWTFFVKALHQRGGSIVATVTSTATNYCCSVWNSFGIYEFLIIPSKSWSNDRFSLEIQFMKIIDLL